MADQDTKVYTSDDESLMRRIMRSLKGTVGMGPKDINLPDEWEDTPARRRVYDREVGEDRLRKSDETIKKLQRFGDDLRKQMLIRELERKDAERQALGGK